MNVVVPCLFSGALLTGEGEQEKRAPIGRVVQDAGAPPKLG